VERAAATLLLVEVLARVPLSSAHFLTTLIRIDNFVLGKEFVGEDRGLDRILRRLKLHAEGRQFGGQNS
jgi:hypothetical protein